LTESKVHAVTHQISCQQSPAMAWRWNPWWNILIWWVEGMSSVWWAQKILNVSLSIQCLTIFPCPFDISWLMSWAFRSLGSRVTARTFFGIQGKVLESLPCMLLLMLRSCESIAQSTHEWIGDFERRERVVQQVAWISVASVSWPCSELPRTADFSRTLGTFHFNWQHRNVLQVSLMPIHSQQVILWGKVTSTCRLLSFNNQFEAKRNLYSCTQIVYKILALSI